MISTTVPTTTYNVPDEKPVTQKPARNTPRPSTSVEEDGDSETPSDTCSADNMFLAHENDCNKYYICEHGNRILQRYERGEKKRKYIFF